MLKTIKEIPLNHTLQVKRFLRAPINSGLKLYTQMYKYYKGLISIF